MLFRPALITSSFLPNGGHLCNVTLGWLQGAIRCFNNQCTFIKVFIVSRERQTRFAKPLLSQAAQDLTRELTEKKNTNCFSFVQLVASRQHSGEKGTDQVLMFFF